MPRPDVHPDLLDLTERDRLRALKADRLAEGMSEAEWAKTDAGQRLAILEAWWSLMEELVEALNKHMRGRFVLWLARRRIVIWVNRKLTL